MGLSVYDDLVRQAIAELQDDVRCRCHPAYKDRGLHDPDCNCDSAGAVQVVADRIQELEAKLQDMALDCLAAQGQAEEAYQAQLVAEAEIVRLRHLIPRPDQTQDELVWRDHMRGVPLAALAKEFGITKERMRHRLKRIAENKLHLTGDRGASGE